MLIGYAPRLKAGRHLAPGRGLRHHPGTAALSLACRRSRWRRPRYPRPVASRLPGCQTLFSQAVEGPREQARAIDHRQAEQLQGCAPSGHAVRRSQYGPIREHVPKSLTSPHGNASDKCDGSNLPVRHNDSCSCTDSSATCSTLTVTCCERSIIESYEVALSSFGMQSRSQPDSS